MALKNPVQRAV